MFDWGELIKQDKVKNINRYANIKTEKVDVVRIIEKANTWWKLRKATFIGRAIRRRELIMNHLNPTHSWCAPPKGKERKINSSQYKSHWLLSIDTMSIFCWDLFYIKSHSTHKLLFFTFSSLPIFLFYCPYFQVFTLKPIESKKKMMMGSSVMMKKRVTYKWDYGKGF